MTPPVAHPADLRHTVEGYPARPRDRKWRSGSRTELVVARMRDGAVDLARCVATQRWLPEEPGEPDALLAVPAAMSVTLTWVRPSGPAPGGPDLFDTALRHR